MKNVNPAEEDQNNNVSQNNDSNNVAEHSNDDSDTHKVFLATRDENGNWINDEQFEVNGSINNLESAYFLDGQCLVVSYDYLDGNNKVSKIELWKNKEKIWERNNAKNASFVKSGTRFVTLTWYEGGKLFGMENVSIESISQLTPDDLKIPSSDYKICGKFGDNSLMLIGTGSADGNENAFAIIYDPDKNVWGMSNLTDAAVLTGISQDEQINGRVNEYSVGFTNENDPILFYSVKKYRLEKNYSNEKLKEVMVGEEDPRFTDLQTNLYVKGRKANQKLKITEIIKNDEDAQKGKPLPVTIKFENSGLYPLDTVYVYADGKQISTVKLDSTVSAGSQGEAKTTFTIPSDADKAFDIVFGISSKNTEEPEDTLKTTFGIGTFSVDYNHSLTYGDEVISVLFTNHGFAKKNVTWVVYEVKDDGSKNVLHNASMDTGGRSSEWRPGGLWEDSGHKDIQCVVLMEGESLDDIDSTKTAAFKGLDQIYLQPLNTLPSGVEYRRVMAGFDDSWTIGSGRTFTMKFTNNRIDDSDVYDNFEWIKFDNNPNTLVENRDFKRYKGSLLIVLQPEFLNTLPLGEHIARIKFKNAEKVVDTSIFIVKPSYRIPVTGIE